MLALPQLKALLKEHNLYRCYINKDEDIALLLEKGIITTTDLYQPKDKTKKPTQVTQVASNTDSSKYAHLKGIRTNPKSVKIHELETDSVTVFPSAYKVYRALGIYPSFIRDCKVWKGRYMIKVCC